MNTTTAHVHLGPAVRTMRLAAGLSLREMARRIGISPAYLSGVEREKVPTPTHERLRSMASVLGVPPRCLTALSERLSPDLIEYLEATPEAVRFLRMARLTGLGADDFAAMASRMTGKPSARSGGPASMGRAVAPPIPRLGRLLDPDRTWCRLTARTKAGLLESLTRRALRGSGGVDVDRAVGAVLARDEESSTGLGGGVALSHAEVRGLTDSLLGVCTLARPLDFGAIDGLPVSLVFLILGREAGAGDRLRVLARIAQLCVRTGMPAALSGTRSARDLHEALRRLDAEED